MERSRKNCAKHQPALSAPVIPVRLTTANWLALLALVGSLTAFGWSMTQNIERRLSTVEARVQILLDREHRQ